MWGFRRKRSNMTVTIERVPGEPIIMCTINEPFSLRNDLPCLGNQVDGLMNAIPDYHVYRIYDFRGLKFSLYDVVSSMLEEAANNPANARIVNILVGKGTMIELASRAYQNELYGAHEPPVFGSMEQALKFARNQIVEERATG